MEQLANKEIIDIKISSLWKEKQKSLLDEVLELGTEYEKGHPIIVVPPSPLQGNICIYNSV